MLRSVEASRYIKVPPRLAFSVLAGYETYRDWMPDVLQSRRLATEGDIAIAEFLAPVYGREKLVLEFVESPDHSLIFHQIDRYREDGLSGRWDLEEVDGGSSVVVRGIWNVKNSFFMIATRGHMRHVLERTLDALASRSMRLSAFGTGRAGSKKHTLFSLRRTEDALEIELDGETYRVAREVKSAAP